jgi:hypothetical protein
MFEPGYLALAIVSAAVAIVLCLDGALLHAACASAASGSYAALGRQPPPH